MGNNVSEKTPPVTSKSFMAVGPTLHYSHENVQICWFLAMFAFALCCLFWSKIVTGSFGSFDAAGMTDLQSWHLNRYVSTGVSIFEYPWQILVLGLLMGVLGIAPVLVAQLMSFSHSLPFILAVLFLANLPGLALFLCISCVGVACRPLRFRSRIIAIALCVAPQLIYWGTFGGGRDQEALVWGISFAPWVCAWLMGLLIAGTVLMIGHFTRYKPGLIWTSTGLVFLTAIGVFETKIGFDELAYQLYVAKNNPELVSEFHDHSIKEDFDRVLEDPKVKEYLDNLFYPTELIRLREELKQELIIQLGYEQWPVWFVEVPEYLDFQKKRQWLNKQYDLFINAPKSWWMPDFLHKQLARRRSTSPRMTAALYYKGMLSEYKPDIRSLKEKEVLHFYMDYPLERSRQIWHRLYTEFPDSLEALEANWRIASYWAGQGRFEPARELLEQTTERLKNELDRTPSASEDADSLSRPFRKPKGTIMTRVKLTQLLGRINHLQSLISEENWGATPESRQRLARFIKLNPHTLDYVKQLEALEAQLEEGDCLLDNVALARDKLIADEQLREERLGALHREYANTDGGTEALFELGLLKTHLYKTQANGDQKKALLADAVATLESFLNLYPHSYYSAQVKGILTSLPVSQTPSS